MVDISSGDKKINITVSSLGNKGNIATSPDMSMFYTERSREWAISDKIVNNDDYSSKYYAQKSKEQAQISTNKTTEVVNSGNEALTNIDNAKTGALTDIETNKTNAITDIVNQENLSVDNVNTAGSTQVTNVNNAGITQVNNVNTAGTNQVNLAKEQVTIATNQATIATTQAGIATAKTTEVVESGNTALSNIATAKSSTLNEINTTGAGYVNNAEQYAQNALTSANNASLSENNALSYKNSALESSQVATEKAVIATTQANTATTKANEALASATNAKSSETNAKSSETRCEEILSRLGTVIKIKGRVDNVGDLPLGDNLDGDAYLVGEEGLDSYPEYYWYKDHWEFLGTTGTSLSWGLISGDIADQSDLQTVLNNKQDKGNYALKSEIPTNNNQLANGAGYITSSYHDSTKQDVISDLATIREGASKGATAIQNTNNCVHLTGNETIAGTKTFSSTISGNITGSSTSCTGNSATATKATQDSSGQQINTTYIKGLTASNATITVTKGNGTTSTATINNVANATKATQDGSGNVITSTYLKKTEGYHPPLLSTVWSDHLLNDTSWLRADTFSWQSGTTYSLAYNELLSEYNNSASVSTTEGSITFKRTPKGYKIALATQETAIAEKYSTDGIAWYYILDTTNKQFKLPRTKFGFEGLRDNVGDDITERLPNITSGNWNGIFADFDSTEVEGSAIRRASYLSDGKVGSGNYRASYNFNASRSSSTYQDNAPVQERATQMCLYFYVGEFTKSAEAQTAGLKAELLNGKLDISNIKRYPIEVSDKSLMPSWYVVYNDGWCEQGGVFDYGSNARSASASITFIKQFNSNDYGFRFTTNRGTSGNHIGTVGAGNKTQSGITATFYGGGSSDYARYFMWEAKGYIS